MEYQILNQFKKLGSESKSTLFSKLYELNFSNQRISLIALFLIYIPILFLDYFKYKQGLWNINLGYKYLFVMHTFLYCFLFIYFTLLFFLTPELIKNRGGNLFCYIGAFFLQTWCALYSAINQMLFGDISIYIISLFCLPLLFKFNSKLEFIKLLFAHIVFLVAVPTYNVMIERTEGIWVNSTVAVILAFIASRVSYTFKIKELTSHLIILKQKEELIAEKEKTENATKDKNEFIAIMSHEIQNQMKGVIGILQLLEYTKLNEEQKEYTTILDSSVKNLLTIISDILDFTRMESGVTELENTPFDLPSLMKELISISSSSSSLNNNIVKLHLSHDVPTYISTDRIRLSQILLNLLSNAVKFTKSGTIDLYVSLKEKKESKIVLGFEVRDTGVGIPSSRIDTIFEMYTRGEISSSRVYKGTGLGLAISKRLVEMMGGSISLRSEEGKGTSFTFTIQTEDHDYLLESKKDSTNKESTATKNEVLVKNIRLKILLVDDNEINIKLGRKVFEKLGYEVQTAFDGNEAVEICRENEFDIIFMDLRMPVLNGFEATEQINKTKKKATDKPLIIALTANANNADRERCMSLGMVDFITKPLDVSRIKDYIIYIVGKYNISE